MSSAVALLRRGGRGVGSPAGAASARRGGSGGYAGHGHGVELGGVGRPQDAPPDGGEGWDPVGARFCSEQLYSLDVTLNGHSFREALQE